MLKTSGQSLETLPTNRITEEVVGIKRTRQVRPPPEDVRKACKVRRKSRLILMNNPSPLNKSKYAKLNKTVKYEVKKWKKKLLETEVSEMEMAHAKINSHELFKRVKKLAKEKRQDPTGSQEQGGYPKDSPC